MSMMSLLHYKYVIGSVCLFFGLWEHRNSGCGQCETVTTQPLHTAWASQFSNPGW